MWGDYSLGHSGFSLYDGYAAPEDHYDWCLKNAGEDSMALAFTDHGHMNGVGYIAALQKKIKGKGVPFKLIWGCLLAGQEILTKDGVKNIEDIKVGDEVLTHKGRYRKVLTTMKKEYCGNLYEVFLVKGSRSLFLTEEHPILIKETTNKNDKPIIWKKPNEIQFGRKYIKENSSSLKWKSFVCLPKLQKTAQDKINIYDYVSDIYLYNDQRGYSKGNRSWNISKEINLNEDFAYFAGLYVAEGSTHINRQGNIGNTCFSFHLNEEHLSMFVGRYLKDIFNVDSSIKVREEKMIREVVFCNNVLGNLFVRLFGKGAKNKKIPDFIFTASDKIKQAFIQGLLDGDGKKGTRNDLKVASKNLAWGFRTLLASFGYWSSVLKVVDKKNHIGYSVSYSPNRKWKRTHEDEKYIFKPIKEIKKSEYNGLVYNIEVEEDNSYVSDFILHNCEAYYIPSLDEWTVLKQERDVQKEVEKKEKKSRKKDEDDNEGLVFENEKESKSKYFDPITRRNHLVLTAYNAQGLVNLYRLVTRSHREGFYKKPRIDFRMLRDCNEGLLASTACLAGIPSWCSLQASDMITAHAMYDQQLGGLMELFGKDRFFLELQFNNYPEQQLVNQHVVEYAKKTGYKLIATADSHFPKPEDWKARELYRMLGYQMKGEVVDKAILEKSTDQLEAHLYLKNGDQLYQSYKSSEFGKTDVNDQLVKEAIERTYDIAHQLCENIVPDSSTKLPKPLKMKEGKTPFETLSGLALDGLKKKGKAINKEYVDRLIHELKIIKKLNLADYFLTKEDSIDTLRKRMFIGPGRGSGAGSLVNYVLNITSVDPIREGLLFERFLSSTKAEADIDTDVELKDQALDILKERFGKDNVIAISNYNKLQLKSIVKDLSKLYGVPFQEVNAVTSVMEKEAKNKILAEINHDQKLYEFSFEKARQYSPSFAAFLEKYPNVAADVQYLYQEVKSIGRHAGGVIILPDAESCLPVIRTKNIDQSPINEGITAQHTKLFGLIKYDFLGLATLEIIHRCIEIILKNQNKPNGISECWDYYNTHLHPDVIDPKDAKVLQNVYWEGRWPSIFQFEEVNVQEFAKRVQPISVDEISQITALWRPGALGAGADKKYLEANIEKQHPIMDEILMPTRNCLIYQEQFMFLANKLAGFSLEESDVLRKILVKPAQDLGAELRKQRAEYRERFIDGCVKNGLSEERATLLWDDEIAHYISYGFNKSHSICYAYNSYICAWLFTYYPLCWMQACLEKDPDPTKAINSIRKLGYEVSKVDINHSKMHEWNFVNNSWLPPLTSLKGVGDSGAAELINKRPDGGFKSIHDFFFNEFGFWRWSKLNKKCLEALIKMETFSSLNDIGTGKTFLNYGHLHRALFQDLPDCTWKDFEKIKKRKTTLEQAAAGVDNTDFTSSEKILFQKEIIGFYDKALVVGKYLDLFEKFQIDSIDFDEDDGSKQKVWGVVEDIKKATTKNNKTYYVIKASGASSKEYTFKAWIKDAEAALWSVGSVLVFGLDYSPNWGYSLSRKSKIIKVNK